MGLAQTFLTIAAISLLGMITLTLNASYLTANQTMIDSEFTVEAVSLAQSYVERAIGKSYDEQTVINNVTLTSSLSSSLGPETGETNISKFDDFDDFNGYKIKDTVWKSPGVPRAIYDINLNVVYVKETNIEGSTPSRTWHKKLTVQVNCNYMLYPVTMRYIFSYF